MQSICIQQGIMKIDCWTKQWKYQGFRIQLRKFERDQITQRALELKFGIWIIRKNGSFIILEGHTDRINWQITNNQEDCVMSGSTDKCITFWIKENQQWKCNQTLSDNKSKIKQLSLNFSYNQQLSCGTDKLILLIQKIIIIILMEYNLKNIS
ncbi:unnamed protein product [Paramecium primaurelia]|uniref:Uncharacterized protein n=1 Tax=Paramecium primaurelia TaxID=5886 RepID=A0A8S1N5Z2_PARPR|nr:unnamed protein product [Paramecium primaurelia]